MTYYSQIRAKGIGGFSWKLQGEFLFFKRFMISWLACLLPSFSKKGSDCFGILIIAGYLSCFLGDFQERIYPNYPENVSKDQ